MKQKQSQNHKFLQVFFFHPVIPCTLVFLLAESPTRIPEKTQQAISTASRCFQLRLACKTTDEQQMTRRCGSAGFVAPEAGQGFQAIIFKVSKVFKGSF